MTLLAVLPVFTWPTGPSVLRHNLLDHLEDEDDDEHKDEDEDET